MEGATDSGKDGDHQRQVSDDDEETEIEETAYDFHDFNIHQAVIKVLFHPALNFILASLLFVILLYSVYILFI